jgi:excisionase family DNA binding protein
VTFTPATAHSQHRPTRAPSDARSAARPSTAHGGTARRDRTTAARAAAPAHGRQATIGGDPESPAGRVVEAVDDRLRLERLLVSPEEAAEILGIGRNLVYDLMRTNALPSVKVGRLRRIPTAHLREYVAGLPRTLPQDHP